MRRRPESLAQIPLTPGEVMERDAALWTATYRVFISAARAQVAQLVEHCTENAGVGGSIPPLGTIAKIRF
jgi:hypothetical protein